ncbi:MAG: hypothetical protein N3E47_08195 [Candidatus Bathyarchaeota archaeon]|nr:hypothetical protein [Candidatus Bathyarchaeota archaeon]
MSDEKSDGKGYSGLEDKIEKIKSDTDKVIGELKSEVEDLKNTLVELKASLSEMENPFNLLTSLVEEGVLRKNAGEAQSKAAEKDEPKRIEEKKANGQLIQSSGGESPEPSAAGYDMSIALIKWVWTLLDLGFDVDDVERISSYCEFFSLLPRRSSHYISAIAPAVEKAKALNLSEDMMALSIYGAAKASGIRIDPEDIMDIVFNALRKLIAKPSESISMQG